MLKVAQHGSPKARVEEASLHNTVPMGSHLPRCAKQGYRGRSDTFRTGFLLPLSRSWSALLRLVTGNSGTGAPGWPWPGRASTRFPEALGRRNGPALHLSPIDKCWCFYALYVHNRVIQDIHAFKEGAEKGEISLFQDSSNRISRYY